MNNNSIENIVLNLIDNVYNFYQVNNDIITAKNQDLFKFCTHDFAVDRGRARPYPGVISSMIVSKANIENVTIIENEAIVKATFLVSNYVERGVEYYNSLVKYYIDVNLIKDNEDEKWYVDYLKEDYEMKKKVNDDDISVEEIKPIDRAVLMILDNKDNFENIKYRFKGKSGVNPIFSYENYYLDSFSLIYWILYTNEIEVDSDFNLPYLLSTVKFKQISNKGHKYNTILDDLKDGDILFFGKNDSYIGIYLGDNKFFTITGKFPQDNSSPTINDIEEFWEEFNGRVIRYREGL